MARAAERSGRKPGEVTLVAVTKTLSVARIEEAIAAGLTHLAENRVQEAESKYARRGTQVAEKVSLEGITLHMIGGLQRNKSRHAVRLFDWVQSVDRLELVEALERTAGEERRAEIGPLPVLLEVNTTGEESKGGVSPVGLPGLAAAVAACKHIEARGLMTVARQGADEPELRETFAGLRGLLEELQREHPKMEHLSMGMTDDYEIAIEECATMVRLGRAIFGEHSV